MDIINLLYNTLINEGFMNVPVNEAEDKNIEDFTNDVVNVIQGRDSRDLCLAYEIYSKLDNEGFLEVVPIEYEVQNAVECAELIYSILNT